MRLGSPLSGSALRSKARLAWRALACAGILALSARLARASTITVNSAADTTANDGVCTLREAITAANTNTASGAAPGECVAGAGSDTIVFAIPGAGVKTITPATPLPTITEVLFINGYSQTGASANTNALNGGINAVLLIELNGDTAGGLLINAAGSVVRGLNIHCAVGNEVEVNASNVTLAGNFFGTNPAGTALGSVGGGVGLRVTSGDNTIIGGPAAADRNLISSNGSDKLFMSGGDGTRVEGNYIGTDVTGNVALNDFAFSHVGITVHNPASNTIIVGNLISGNSGGGIQMGAFGNPGGGGAIQGNLIGTQRDGISPLGNLNSGGIDIANNGVTVGGTGAGEGNTIAFNIGGVNIGNNFVGNRILGNSMFSNGAFLGIRLFAGGPLPNDACDVDVLPGNQGQNYPVITSAPVVAGVATISGTLNSTASTAFRVEFFSSLTCHASGNGEGLIFIGFADVTTDATCNATFGPLAFSVPAGQTIITATATATVSGNTSEFAVCVSGGPPPTPITFTPTQTLTPTPTPTPTSTPTRTNTPMPPTNTPAGGPPTTTPLPPGAATVPTLSVGMLLLLGGALALAALLVLRRNG